MNFDVSLLPNTAKGSGMQMTDVTGVRLLSIWRAQSLHAPRQCIQLMPN